MVLLRERFAAPEFAFLPHVRNGTGYTRRTTRTADALAMSLWPSRGLELHGFELKSARSDWLRERSDPEKAEEICRFTDRWWVVVGADNVIPEGELFPPTWGLIVARAGKLVVAREAPKLEAKPLDRAQLAAILRRAAECVVPRDEIEAAISRARHEVEKDVEERVESRTKWLRERQEAAEQRIHSFEAASGLNLNDYRGVERIGTAVRFVLDGGLDAQEARLRGLHEAARDITTALEQRLAEVPAAHTGTEG